MNQLNSILIEGSLITSPTYDVENLKASARFTVSSTRFYRDAEGQTEIEETHVEVVTYGKLAEAVHRLGVKGRGVRVVGRLHQAKGHLGVVAEHVEFRPLDSAPQPCETEIAEQAKQEGQL